MAVAGIAGISDTWSNLRTNPVFRRNAMPRGVRQFARSPISRAVALTILAIIFFQFIQQFLSWMIYLTMIILFWFLIKAIQRYFCWMELRGLHATGTLDDYINSGMSRADIVMGVVYPAFVSEIIAITLCMVVFMVTSDYDTALTIVVLVLVIFNIAALFRPPFLFHPEAEQYLRKRNPVALFFISISVVVPLIIWFALIIPITYGLAFLAVRMKWQISGDTISAIGIVATLLIYKYPQEWWQMWQLKRFYGRYRSLDDLFERYIEADNSQLGAPPR